MPPRLSPRRAPSFISSCLCSIQAGTSKRPFSLCLNVHTARSVTSRVTCKARPGIVKRRAFHASSTTFAPKDPYQVLGVKKDASPAEIKKVYFALARKYHPDTNTDKDAQEKFVEIQEAYDILKDEKKRADYDQYGSASQQPGFDSDAFSGFSSGFHNFGGGFRPGAGRTPESMFEELFGAFGGRGRTRGNPFTEEMRGNDLEATLGVTFMEACKGTSRTIPITPIVNCSTCSGSGLKAGAKRATCTVCGGTGTRTYVIESGFHMSSTCGNCHGSGTTVPRGSQCGECGGVGQIRIRKNLKVDIPAGVEDGMTIRIPNVGDAPISGKGIPGDLLVRVNVAASKLFQRQGPNLHHEARIPLHTALLGGTVRVPTLDGEVDVRVPGGTQQGEEMVLKGRGVSSVFGNKGDLFVKFAVQLPRSFTVRQREILQQYADDVEGRTPAASATSSGSGQPTSKDRPDVQDKQTPAFQADEENGTASFTQSASLRGGWVSRVWSKFRELTGF